MTRKKVRGTFDMPSPILCCFISQLRQNFQISQKWDLKSQQPYTNPGCYTPSSGHIVLNWSLITVSVTFPLSCKTKLLAALACFPSLIPVDSWLLAGSLWGSEISDWSIGWTLTRRQPDIVWHWPGRKGCWSLYVFWMQRYSHLK